jgi:4'-phosphopantetheinyl transferase
VQLNDFQETVSVWFLGLDRDPSRVEQYLTVLSDDELERAARLRSFDLRADFVYTRGVLRHVLAPYAGVDPAHVRFTYENRGKPHLVATQGGDNIGFNTSHSRDISVFAVARGRSVGVDVEQLRDNHEHDAIAERWFSHLENKALAQLPVEDRLEAFFSVWSRKEAVVKALGTGISQGLDNFSVSVPPREPAAILETLWDPSQKNAWSIHDLPLPTGYVGSVVASGKDWTPTFQDWV